MKNKLTVSLGLEKQYEHNNNKKLKKFPVFLKPIFFIMVKRIVTFGAIAIVIVAVIVAMFRRSDKELVVAIEEESAFEMSIDSAVSICCIH